MRDFDFSDGTPCCDLNVKCGYITEGQESAHGERSKKKKTEKEGENKDLRDLKGFLSFSFQAGSRMRTASSLIGAPDF